MKFLLSLLLVIIVTPTAFAESLSILQGATSADTTHFTVVTRADENIDLRVNAEASIQLTRVEYPESEHVVWRAKVTGLRTEQDYMLQVVQADTGAVIDERHFKTLNPQQPGGRLALVSCMLRQLHNPFMWNALAEPNHRPDALLILGDAVYLDRHSLLVEARPENGLQVWEDFVASRQTLNLYYWKHLVPVITVWDDHDSGGDGVDASYALMPEIRRIYDVFFANDEIPGTLNHGPGLAKNFELFGINMIMVDGRSFRNLDASSPLFGEPQVEWMLSQLKPGPNLLLSGSQFYGRYLEKDSLEYTFADYEPEFTKRLREAGARAGAKIAFASGDIHFSEVQSLEADKLGYPTAEVTSSSVHSFAVPGHYMLKPYNPRRVAATGTHNALLLDFSADRPAERFDFKVQSLGWRGDILFEVDVAIGEALTLRFCESLLTGE